MRIPPLTGDSPDHIRRWASQLGQELNALERQLTAHGTNQAKNAATSVTVSLPAQVDKIQNDQSRLATSAGKVSAGIGLNPLQTSALNTALEHALAGIESLQFLATTAVTQTMSATPVLLHSIPLRPDVVVGNVVRVHGGGVGVSTSGTNRSISISVALGTAAAILTLNLAALNAGATIQWVYEIEFAITAAGTSGAFNFRTFGLTNAGFNQANASYLTTASSLTGASVVVRGIIDVADANVTINSSYCSVEVLGTRSG